LPKILITKLRGKRKNKKKKKNPAIQWFLLNLRPGFVTWIWGPGTCNFVPES
jgi:hypothetical protein